MTGFRTLILVVFSVLTSAVSVPARAAPDALASWNDGSVKKAIVGYVTSVSQSGSPQLIAPADRIAVFDIDGTIWPEQPVAEVAFMLSRVKDMVVRNPDLRSQPPYDSLFAKGAEILPSLPQADILKIFVDTHSGMTEDDFTTQVREFFYTAKHPLFGVPYARTVYQPMLELIAYLRANGFKIFLSTNGDIAFARAISADYFGVPAENVIGTYFTETVEENGGRLRVVRQPKLGAYSDREGKIGAIARHIGKRPVFVAGNVGSGGDAHMARFSMEGLKPSLQILINHDDAARERAYGSDDRLSLDWAKSYGWQLVSMKSDWKRIFGANSQ
ncbi:HAD family hydrolase [Govanella unica]|uniref:Haloacid dehalogenase-like hydrolase n=1 Tax=Govanella unica TaxID=2975056 RepID=A0A9X3TY25_9PROT|nr:HAD family hydrolase [Govania unica]MDA5193858.1 haloacid dehalogenase-like hydrolase [Govania unica]